MAEGLYRIFVTGASGFIGNRLASRLAAEGNDVSVLLRNTSLNHDFLKKGIRVVNGDLFNTGALRSGMEGCDMVFHLAAYARPVSLDKDLPYRTNVEGTRNVLETARECAVRKLVVTSSAGTSGFSTDGRPVDEATIRESGYYTEYDRTKSIVEKMAAAYSSEKMNVIVVNPSRVFGPGRLSRSNSVTTMMKLYLQGFWRIIPGDGTSIGNYAFIDDVVNGHILAAAKGKSGEKYLLGGANVTFDEFFETLGEVTGRKMKMYHVSASGLKRVAAMQGLLSSIAGKPPLISAVWLDKYLENWIISSNKAMTCLSYSITPFREAVSKTVAWLKSGRREQAL